LLSRPADQTLKRATSILTLGATCVRAEIASMWTRETRFLHRTDVTVACRIASFQTISTFFSEIFDEEGANRAPIDAQRAGKVRILRILGSNLREPLTVSPRRVSAAVTLN